MNRTLVLLSIVFVIGLVIGVGIAPSFIGVSQEVVTQTVTKNVSTFITTTVTHALTLPQGTTTQTVTMTQGQGPVTQTVTVTSTGTVTPSAGGALVQYCFSPGGHCDMVLVDLINHATTSIHVLIYSFTLDDVANALIQARDRGVDVKIVMEKDNANGQGSEYQTLKQANMNIRLDSNSALMHDKVAIIDNHIIVTGSFNWTASGTDHNNENMAILDSQSWAAAYETTFQSVYSVATL